MFFNPKLIGSDSNPLRVQHNHDKEDITDLEVNSNRSIPINII